jgi:PAS domain S-box-containing protein
MNQNKGRVLVVDDDRLGRNIISTIVGKLGYLVDQAESGKLALEMAPKGAYDCILLDLVMPDMDGFEVLLRLKQDPETMHVPVIVISGNDDLLSASRSIGMGAIDYIQKPVNAILLNARLQTSLAEKRIRDLEKQHLKEMRLAQARMAAVIGDSPLGIIMLDLGMVVREANPTFMNMMRATEEKQLLGPIESYCAGIDHSCKMEMAAYLNGKADGTFCKEATMRRLDGTTYDVQMTMSLVQAEGDPDAFAVAMVQDITERKTAEGALRLNEGYLRTIFESTPYPLVMSSMEDGSLLNINRQASDFFEMEHGDAQNIGAMDFYSDPEDRERMLEQMIVQGYVDNLEMQLRTRKGTVKWVIVTTRSIDNQGQRCLLTALYDITERKRADEALRQSERRYRLLIESANEAIVVAQDGMLRFVNPASIVLTGASELELISKPFISLIHPEDRAMVAENYRKRSQGEPVPDRYMFRLETGEGITRWVEMNAVVIDWEGRPATLNFLTDITERKRAEEVMIRNKEEIARHNNLLSSLFKTLPVGIFMIESPTGKPLLANEMAYQILGRGILSAAAENNLSEVYDAYKLSTNALYPNDELPSVLGMQGISAHVDDIIVVRPDGTKRQLEVFGSPVTDNDGKVWASLVNFTDITDRKRTEEALLMANRKLNLLNSITRHDIVNQTVVLGGYIDLMRKRFPDERMAGTLERLRQATENITKQISFTKDYQDLGSQAAEWSDIGTTFRSSFNLLGPMGVEMETNAGYDVLADRLLQKVFYNLMDNSIRHGEYVTKIWLDCSEDVEGLKVVYRDNGCGVADRSHLFEKGFGKNTGLGLFLTKEILSITNIDIVENGRYGEGARFEMHVPNGVYRKT